MLLEAEEEIEHDKTFYLQSQPLLVLSCLLNLCNLSRKSGCEALQRDGRKKSFPTLKNRLAVWEGFIQVFR